MPLGLGGITWQQAKIEDQRAEVDRELAEQQAQDDALQAYLDQKSQLILERKLLEAEPGDPVYALAQARTSTAILRLDAEHNESVTRFLHDSGLALTPETSEGYGAAQGLLIRIDLSHAILSHAYLVGASLTYSLLRESDLSEADLRYANLSEADLSGADVRYAQLVSAYLKEADLTDANLKEADLTGAHVSERQLLTAFRLDLEGATMPDGQKYEDWLKSKDRAEDR